jgi:Mg2+-importing ATPase
VASGWPTGSTCVLRLQVAAQSPPAPRPPPLPPHPHTHLLLAVAMARRRAIVKRLDAVQNLGAMDVLCTDKTGTLTRDEVRPASCTARLPGQPEGWPVVVVAVVWVGVGR